MDILDKTHLPADQARAILQVMELENTARDGVYATKSDLKEAFYSLDLKVEAVRGEIHALRGELSAKIEVLRGDSRALEGKMARWVLTCTFGQAAMIAGAVYFALAHLRP